MNFTLSTTRNFLRIPNREEFLREMNTIFFLQEEREKLTRAYNFASKVHKNDMRRSGEQYMCHIEDAARIYIRLRRARNAPIAVEDIIDTIVHDTVEDHAECETDFRKIFEGDRYIL